jgi:hypothetical protein
LAACARPVWQALSKAKSDLDGHLRASSELESDIEARNEQLAKVRVRVRVRVYRCVYVSWCVWSRHEWLHRLTPFDQPLRVTLTSAPHVCACACACVRVCVRVCV